MPDKADDIQRLVERIEGAGGPDRVIDGLIWAHIKGDEPYIIGNEPGPFPQKAIMGTRGDLMFVMQNKDIADYIGAPSFSTSIDAAMTLIPDDWTAWEIRSHSARTRFSADLSRLTECDSAAEDWARGRGSTPALALASAALRARITERTDDDA